MSGGMLGIGTSGLQAYQRALATTSHNISNATTEGYSRQRVELSARPPERAGNSFFGTGVQVSAVTRIADQFVESQLRTATSASQQFSVFHDYAKRVDSLLAEADSGLSPGLQRFFGAVQDVANDPTSNAARQVLLSEAESLVDRFRFLDQRLGEQRDLVNGQIASTVEEINRLADALARVNTDIVTALGRGATPNDLLDQRDTLVRALAERVNVTTTEQDDGALNVFIGNGQSLVLGSRSNPLVARPLGEDPAQLDVGFGQTNPIDISRLITGGRLGALLDVRGSVLDVAQNSLGRTAIGLAEAFNEQHRRGQGLDGTIGRDFFQVPQPEVLPSKQGLEPPQVTISDAGMLGTGDFRLVAVQDIGNGPWELRRVPGGQVVDGSRVDLPDDSSVGLSIGPPTPGTNVGDSFLIRPTRTAAAQIATVIDDPRAVAAATPKVEDGAENSETVLSSARFEPAANLPISSVESLKLEFKETGGQLTVLVNGVEQEPSIDEEELSGLRINISTGQGTWVLQFDSVPNADDTFMLSLEPAGAGDNRNSLALGALQEDRFLAGGTSTLEGTYGTLIAEVGTRTRQAEIAAQAQARLLEQAQAQRESISGVNLDEEAANLLRFQQAYQAAAQVVSVTSTLFDTLLSAVRR